MDHFFFQTDGNIVQTYDLKKSRFVFSNLLLNYVVEQNGHIKSHTNQEDTLFKKLRMICEFTYLNSTYSYIL